jgi:hypothetical protein
MSVTFGSQVALVGYDDKVLTSNDKPGTVTLTLVWQALGEMDTDYTVFVHLVDENGTERGQHDSMPMNGAYPTTLWQPGEFITDAHAHAAPDGRPAITAQVGLYQVETGQRPPWPETATRSRWTESG